MITDEELIRISQAPIVGHHDDWHNLRIDGDSEWLNPFSISDFGLEGSLEKYREYILKRPDLMAKIPDLRGESLACHCRHAEANSPMCHGDVLVELYLAYARRMVEINPDYFLDGSDA